MSNQFIFLTEGLIANFTFDFNVLLCFIYAFTCLTIEC